MNNAAKLKVTMRNNSNARALNGRMLAGCRARHNGGKLVIIETTDVDAVTAELDKDNRVVGYSVEDV